MYFCNIVTSSRLYQFIALYNSMQLHISYYEIFVLCMDEDVLRILSKANFKNVHPIPLSEVENEELKLLRQTRTNAEYCWTLKPVFMLHILKIYDFIRRLTYLDADMLFFNDPSIIFESNKSSSVLLSKHNFADKFKYMEKDVGTFNSGIISIKNDTYGIDCLNWWKEKCLEWCFNTTVTGQFGDQKYLQDMYDKFPNVSDISIPGINVAPWNDAGRKIIRKRGKTYIDDFPLILYHFCGFRLRSKYTCIFMFGNTYHPIIHKPYMKTITMAIRQIDAVEPGFNGCIEEDNNLDKFNIFSII